MRECTSSYVGYQNDERTIACVIVNHDSNEKQVFKAGDNIVMDVTLLALHTTLRMMPMLGVERRANRMPRLANIWPNVGSRALWQL